MFILYQENQEEEFEDEYVENSVKVFDTFGVSFHVTLGAIDSFVLAICAQFNTWPFVTVPNFSIRAEKLRKFSNAVVVTNYHFVDKDQRQEWDKYTKANDFWVEDGIENQEKNFVLRETSIDKNYGGGEMQVYGQYEDLDVAKNISFMVSTRRKSLIDY